MKNSKIFLLAFACSVLILTALFLLPKQSKNNQSSSGKKRTIIAITQIAPHPSLDQIRQGIIDQLQEKHPDAEIVFQNAQGSMATAAQIAHNFSAMNPDVVVPITTPSAQSIYAAFKGKKIPIIFAGVTDPVHAKMLKTTKTANANVTGVTDFPPITEQVALMLSYFPKGKLKTVGIIYNPGEANSNAITRKISSELAKNGIQCVQAVASSTTNIASATQSLIHKVDAIYVGNDNTVISGIDAVVRIALNEKIPVFCSDPESIDRGCTATVAPDQYEGGRQVGVMVERLLAGEKIDKINPEFVKKLIHKVNADMISKLDLQHHHDHPPQGGKILGVAKSSSTKK